MLKKLFRKKQEPIEYDKENLKPILKCSICTGEQIAGFRDIRTGKFEEIEVIHDSKELREFMKRYGLTYIAKEY